VRQKNEEGQTHSPFFCLTFFCVVTKTMIKAGFSNSRFEKLQSSVRKAGRKMGAEKQMKTLFFNFFCPHLSASCSKADAA